MVMPDSAMLFRTDAIAYKTTRGLKGNQLALSVTHTVACCVWTGFERFGTSSRIKFENTACLHTPQFLDDTSTDWAAM